MYAVRKSKPQPAEQEHDTATQAFLREVDEALHEENMARLWQQWRVPMFVALLALFGGVAGWQVWGEYQANQQQQAAENLFTLMNNPTETALVEDIQNTGLAGPAVLATFVEARTLQQQGKNTEAVALYDGIAANTSLPQEVQDLGTLYSAIVQATTDSLSAEAKLAMLDANESLFRPTALALQARLTENRGDKATALALWEKLSIIGNVPPSLAQRAADRAKTLRASTAQ